MIAYYILIIAIILLLFTGYLILFRTKPKLGSPMLPIPIHWVLTLISGRSPRNAIDRLVIAAIASVVRQRLPLGAGLRLLANTESGPVQEILIRTSKAIAIGKPLSTALRNSHPRCPGMVISLISTGEKTGNLVTAIDQAELWLVNHTGLRKHPGPTVTLYAFCVINFVIALSTMITVMILPKYQEIFRDFGTPMPPILALFTEIYDWLLAGPGLSLIPSTLGSIMIYMYFKYRPRKTPIPTLPTRTMDWIRWNFPGWRRLEFSKGMAEILRTMKRATDAGLTLEHAAILASDIDVNWFLRKRIRAFCHKIATGTNPKVAASSAELGSVTEFAMAGGLRGNMSQSLHYAASYYENLICRWWTIMRNIAWPATTVILGIIAGFIALALFQPVIYLLDATLMHTGY